MGGQVDFHKPVSASGGMKYIASCSFGKDSMAMLLILLEKGYPLDKVIFYNTEMEFQAIYNNRDKIIDILRERNIKFTELKDPLSFKYLAFEKPVKTRNGVSKCGYNWCGGIARWGTSGKLSSISKHYRNTYGNETIVEYVGVAADEISRIEKYRSKRGKTVKLYPLIEWGLVEKMCLEYCYSHGWNWHERTDATTTGWIELYEILDRVSCWCCSNKNQKEIKNIMIYLPNYWAKIKSYEYDCSVPYKGKGCHYFEEKFGD